MKVSLLPLWDHLVSVSLRWWIIGMLDTPTSGEYYLDGQEVAGLERINWPRSVTSKSAFVFSSSFSCPLNALQNVELPLIYAGVWLQNVGNWHWGISGKSWAGGAQSSVASELSGVKSNVAIARALVNNPLSSLDEPTGALDTKTGNQIMQLLVELNKEGKPLSWSARAWDCCYAKRQIVNHSWWSHLIRQSSGRKGGKLDAESEIAFSSIMAHKMRSFLTMIGIIIGVSSVVVIMAPGDSMSVRSKKHDQITEGYPCLFFSLSKARTAPLRRNNPLLTVSGKKRMFMLNHQTTRILGHEAAKLKGVDSYYVTNSTNVTLSW